MSPEPNTSTLDVAICWHMHQPDYRDPRTGEFQLPWTYLHAIKDYGDMAHHLESVPGAVAVVNFSGVLIEQLEAYTSALHRYRDHGETLPDPLLAALVAPVMPTATAARQAIVEACLRAHDRHMIDRFPTYAALVNAVRQLPDGLVAAYLSDQFLEDLLVWYHLAWLGEHPRRTDPRVAALMARQHGYRPQDRRTLLEVITDILERLPARYAALAEQGRAELSLTPGTHPILPLLLDLRAGREALPDAPQPDADAYPQGEARARWHVQRGVATFERYFGHPPRGCWPSEGALCERTWRLLDDAGFDWLASGAQVLHNSISNPDGDCVHRGWRLRGTESIGYFRDDGLSDLIGFTYQAWDASAAVADLVHHLNNIRTHCEHQPHAIAVIILDGENAWEHYPANGYVFLQSLYRALVDDPHLNPTTLSAHSAAHRAHAGTLERLVAGSWVGGSLGKWIGDPAKNRAWDALVQAWTMLSRHAGELDRGQFEDALAAAEGSDWFWWLEERLDTETISVFQRLFCVNLAALYAAANVPPPEYVRECLEAATAGAEHGPMVKAHPVQH